MRSILRTCAALVALPLVPLAVACATTDDGPPPSGAADDDGGTLTPSSDASISDEADVDSALAPRECSDDGFCHTKLPIHQMLKAVWGDGQGVVWAVSEQGAILRWDQSSWKVHATGLGYLTTVWGSGPNDVWVGGNEGIFHGTGAAPAALKFERTTRHQGYVSSLWGSGATDVWATILLEDGSSPPSQVLHYAPGADGSAPEWSEVVVGEPDERFTHVWGSPRSGVWLGAGVLQPSGDRLSRLYRKPPGASAFELVMPRTDPDDPASAPVIESIVSVSVVSETSIVLLARTLTQDEVMRRVTSTDNGQTFVVGSSEIVREFHQIYDYALWTNVIAGVAQGDLWTGGVAGQIRHFDGREWTPSALAVTKYPVVASFQGIWANGPEDVWFVGEDVALHLDPTKKKK